MNARELAEKLRHIEADVTDPEWAGLAYEKRRELEANHDV